MRLTAVLLAGMAATAQVCARAAHPYALRRTAPSVQEFPPYYFLFLSIRGR
jgi:hypothetical protein